MEHRQQGFEPKGDAFVHIYSKDEIQSLFRGCGLVGLQVGSIVLGKVSYGEIRRIFVFACHVSTVVTKLDLWWRQAE